MTFQIIPSLQFRNISDKIKVEGSIYPNIPGEYSITYQVEDAIGKTAQTVVVYKIKE